MKLLSDIIVLLLISSFCKSDSSTDQSRTATAEFSSTTLRTTESSPTSSSPPELTSTALQSTESGSTSGSPLELTSTALQSTESGSTSDSPLELTSTALQSAESSPTSSSPPELTSTALQSTESGSTSSSPPEFTTRTLRSTGSGPTINMTSDLSSTTFQTTELRTVITGQITGSALLITTEVATSMPTFPTTAVTSTLTATPLSPLIVLSECDFSNELCLSTGREFVNINNGNEFARVLTRDQQPQAPTSGAPSSTKSTSYSERCVIPYNLSRLVSAINPVWDMWFCYNDKCPAKIDGNPTNCSSGTYGLIRFAPADTNKSISLKTTLRTQTKIGSLKQCLYYYYYLPFLNSFNRNPTIETYIITNNLIVNESLIDNVTLAPMGANAWQSRMIEFNASFSETSALTFVFNADASDSTGPGNERTIYFALDNVELYDNNCSYVESIKNPTIPADSSSGADLGLILGLSLGLGIPALFAVIAVIVYCCTRKGRASNILKRGVGNPM